MPGLLSLSGFVPDGFHVDSVPSTEPGFVVRVRSDRPAATCPACARSSRAVRSRYTRHDADLPRLGRPIRVEVVTRRRFCRNERVTPKIFSERFTIGALAPRTRRTELRRGPGGYLA